MPERHPFTEADDDHLAEFIAKKNPELSGRNGNNLYKSLVENPKRWPWSKSHPWQSWCERYKKNTVWFDRKIKSYLREQKAASAGLRNKVSNEAEVTNEAEGRTAKRQGPSEDIAERKRTAPANKQTSTSVDGGKPGDSVKVTEVTGNASTDSGYASTTKTTPDELNKKQSELDASGHPGYITETTYNQRSGDNPQVPSTSSYRSTTLLPIPPRKEEDNISQINELELFGSFAEDEDVTNPPVARSAPTSPATERIYPDVRNIPLPDISEKGPLVLDSLEITRSVRTPRNPSPLKPLPGSRLPSARPPAGPLQGEKRLLKRRVVDDDPFIDNTPPPLSATPERHLATRKAPPVLNEGPFRNLYLPTRNSVENKNMAVWPPTRKRRGNEGPKKITVSHSPTARVIIGRKTQHQVNAIASSSKVKLPPSTVLRPDDPFLIRTAFQESAPPVPIRNGAELSKKQADTAIIGKGTKTSERSWAVDARQPPTKRQKFGHPAVTHQESSHSTVPTSSPATQGNPCANNERPSTRHIDLRESLKKRRLSSRKSPLLSSRGSTFSNSNSISSHTNRRNSAASSTSRFRRQHMSNDGDLELISLFERDLSELGEQYGFALGVVKQTYLQFGTLEKTVVVLRALNAIMKGVQDELYEEMQHLGNKRDHDGTNECDLIPQGIIPKDVSSGGKEKERERENGASSNKRHRQSLIYKPLTTDIEDHSEYSPPSRTRAGRYTKLQKEGREEEALIAASGGRFSMHRRNWSREERISDRRESPQAATIRRMEPSSPLDLDRERSPTPDEEEFVGLSESEGDEEGHYEGGNDDDIEVAIKHRGTDVSADEYEVREPTSEVEQVDDMEQIILMAELKKLCSEVTLGNQTILTAFEDKDLLRSESGDWVMEMFLSLKETQKVRRQEYYRKKATKTEEGEEHEPVADESIPS